MRLNVVLIRTFEIIRVVKNRACKCEITLNIGKLSQVFTLHNEMRHYLIFCSFFFNQI